MIPILMSKRDLRVSGEFIRLLTQYQPDLRTFIISLLPGDSEIDDVLQKTNIALWKKMKNFEPGSNFRAWAFTTARYEVLNHRKTKARRRVFLLDEELLDVLTHEGNESVEETDFYADGLERCMATLREGDRELIHYHYNSKNGLSEYASRVGRSYSSLAVTLFRLRAALRRCVEEHVLKKGGAL